MGSFNATCSISDLTIESGDKIYIQLILPSWVKNPYSIDGEKVGCGEKSLRISNSGALGEFVPFGFPMECVYSDSGYGDGFPKNHNVDMLEKFFNISIENIFECASDDRWYKHSYQPAIEKKKKEEYDGQYKNWTVGDNKMKNIEILKQLTLTYFKKEHYDFLSKEMIGSDGSFNKERIARLGNMVKGLTELDKVRPTGSDGKFFEVGDITDEIREGYKRIFGDRINDDEIVSTENADHFKWWYPFINMFYIPSISNYNMFQILPIGAQDADDVKKQFMFLSNLYNLTKVLRPSYYGSQENNFDAYVKFHSMSVNMVNGDVLDKKADIILDEVAWALKQNLEKINNQEIADKIKKDIIDGLVDYGYDIDL